MNASRCRARGLIRVTPRTSGRLAIGAALLLASVAGVLALSPIAAADRGLRLSERQAIVSSVVVAAPNGRRIRDPACIAGSLSTVDRRWATFHLDGGASCVRRYGGASGESILVRRRTRTSRRWAIRGAIGDHCRRGTGGAPDRVLVDLGCTFY